MRRRDGGRAAGGCYDIKMTMNTMNPPGMPRRRVWRVS